ncbi:MAG TPA: hypothetical protein VIL55_08330 [Naasia sp.]
MNIKVRTPDGKQVSLADATLPIGRTLRIAPAFTAVATAADISVETTIHVAYSPDFGRYRIAASGHQIVGPDGEITPSVLRRIRLGELLAAAVPYCVAVSDDELGHGIVRDLVGASGRLLPKWMADTAAHAGPTRDTLELVQLAYGVAALAGQPPMQAVAAELGIPTRTATHWIARARQAGLLEGITYTAGRQPKGS